MPTFAHLSEVAEIRKFCEEELHMTDFVEFPWGFRALRNRLAVSRGNKSASALPGIDLGGKYSPEDKKKYDVLKRRFKVSTKVAALEYLGIDMDS